MATIKATPEQTKSAASFGSGYGSLFSPAVFNRYILRPRRNRRLRVPGGNRAAALKGHVRQIKVEKSDHRL